MFKKIVEEIAKGTPIDEACGMIDRAYQNDKFSWKDHETLYALINRIERKFELTYRHNGEKGK